jgi:large subunit ribosomal protein L10
MNKEEKNTVVAELAESLNRATIAVVSEYKSIKAAESDDLRRRMRVANGEFRVAKNTLVRLAIKNTKYEALEPNLGGAIGLIFSYADPVQMAKTISSLREFGDRFKIRGGVLEGKPLTAQEISALATLPPREVILAQLLGLLQAPATRLVRLLNEPGCAVARLLDAVRQKQAASAPAPADQLESADNSQAAQSEAAAQPETADKPEAAEAADKPEDAA